MRSCHTGDLAGQLELRIAFGQHLAQPLALGDVDVDTDHAARNSGKVIGNETARR